MADDPIERLEELGTRQVAPPTPQFIDRLESRLRVQHSELPAHQRRRRWWPARAVVPRLAIAAALVVAGVFGVNAIVDDDATVPVEVADGGIDAAHDSTNDGGVSAPADAAPSPTPTSTATPTVAPDVAPTARSGSTPQPGLVGATPDPRPTRTPDASPPLAPTPRASDETPTPPAPTATPVRPATPVPVPTAIPVPTPSPTPRARPTRVPTPEPTPGLAAIDLVCAARAVGDRVGVLCEWTAPIDVNVVSYTVVRSRNGGDTEVVATIRATAPRSFADRDVLPGDRVIYLVRASAGDRPVAASERQVVDVPTG